MHIILPEYRYCYKHLGVVENEFCPVLVVFGDFMPSPNPAEVQAVRWVKWSDFLDEIHKPNNYSEWCQEEAELLSKSGEFKKLYDANTK